MIAITYFPSGKDAYTEGSDIWEALNKGRNVALDSKGFINVIWDKDTKEIYDILGNKTGGIHKESPDEDIVYAEGKDAFGEGGDEWEALNAGRQVTQDDHGWIIDVWDPITGKLYDILGNEIGTRADPFPSDNNIAILLEACKALNREIHLLRAISRSKYISSSQKLEMSGQIMALLRKRGEKLWLCGRLKRRKTLIDKKYLRKRTGAVPVETPRNVCTIK